VDRAQRSVSADPSGAVILEKGRGKPAAEALMKFLKATRQEPSSCLSARAVIRAVLDAPSASSDIFIAPPRRRSRSRPAL